MTNMSVHDFEQALSGGRQYRRFISHTRKIKGTTNIVALIFESSVCLKKRKERKNKTKLKTTEENVLCYKRARWLFSHKKKIELIAKVSCEIIKESFL